MKRLVVVLVLLSTACVLPGIVEVPGATPTPVEAPASATAVFPTTTPVVKPRPTYTPTPAPQPTPTLASDPRLEPDDVLLLPQPLSEGDRLSVDVDPSLPPGFVWEDGDEPQITLTLPDGETASTGVAEMGFDNVAQARFYWIDDVPSSPATSSPEDALIDLPEVDGQATYTAVYTLTLTLPPDVPDPNPDNNTLVLRVPVRPRESLSPPEPGAQWAVTETAGFSLHYLTGSAAERDLASIVDAAAQAYDEVIQRFDAMGARDVSGDPVRIYLLDRVVGQGGYASAEWVAVSYADRAYSPVMLDLVLRHELTHRLDGAIGCDDAPPMLREGLAVAVSGGHYRREALREKAAALFGTTHYIPLPDLAEDFYTHQHEVGYLEAGAVVSYLIERWGWEIVPRVCRAASAAEGDDTERWEAALEETGVDGPAALEQQWHTWLQASNVVPQDARLLELELKLMDAMRDYQATHDPAAHFLEGMLFSPAEAERLEIVADFVRRPRDPESIALELLLAMGQESLAKRDPVLLEMVLATLKAAMVEGFEHATFAAGVLSVTHEALAQGWEPYRLILERDNRLRVYVVSRSAWPLQSLLIARKQGDSWDLSGTIWSE